MVEVLEVKLAKQHHDDLEEAVPEVAEDLRVWQENVEGEGESEQNHGVAKEEFKDCPGDLQDVRIVLTPPLKILSACAYVSHLLHIA